MTQFQFQLLPISDQLDLLYSKGVFLAKRRESEKSILLYQLEGFYAEVFYHKHRWFPMSLRCFRSTSLLDPYLEHMDLEHLVT